MPEPRERAVLFADVVGSTAVYRRLGDATAERLVSSALMRVSERVRRYAGRQIKTIGDCVLGDFPSGDAAAQAAIDMQLDTRLPLPHATGEELLRLRIGFFKGPVTERDGDIFGDAVNIAARVCDLAKADQILTTEDTAQSLAPGLQENSRLFDRAAVKGVDFPLTVVQLLWERRAVTEMISLADLDAMTSARLLLRCVDKELVLSPGLLRTGLNIGRDPGCDWVMPAPYASRTHARIEWNRGKFLLLDQSTNGTFLMRRGEAPIYLRNESVVLQGTGVIALGEQDPQESHRLHYSIS